MKNSFEWACGIFEGEGTTGAFGNGNTQKRLATMRVVMVDIDIIRRFRRAVGCGRIKGPVNYKSSKQPLWVWVLQEQQGVLDLLTKMYPHMGKRRRAQAKPVIAYCRKRLRLRGLL